MAKHTLKWAWQQALPPAEKLLLLALADAADGQHTCSPSIATLAAQCAVSTRTVRRLLHHLEAKTLIARKRQCRGDGSRMANRYHVQCEDVHTVSFPNDMDDTGGWPACQGTVKADVATVKSSLQDVPSRESRVPRFPELARVIG